MIYIHIHLKDAVSFYSSMVLNKSPTMKPNKNIVDQYKTRHIIHAIIYSGNMGSRALQVVIKGIFIETNGQESVLLQQITILYH